jgi:hypothetical protein
VLFLFLFYFLVKKREGAHERDTPRFSLSEFTREDSEVDGQDGDRSEEDKLSAINGEKGLMRETKDGGDFGS